MSDDLKALEAAFVAAIELRAQPRRVFLAQLRRDRPQLADALERLLRSDDQGDDPLLQPVEAAVAHWSKDHPRQTD